MNYIFAFIAISFIVFAARFLSSPAQKPKAAETSSPSAVENLFAPGASDASKKLKEMREQQDRMLQEQKKMQQQRLDTYNQ